MSLVIPGQAVSVDGQVAARELTKEDVRIEKIDDTFFIDVIPPDLARINLFIRVPYAWPLAIKTLSGNVTLNGNVASASIETGTGAVNLSVPIKTTALFVKSEERPGDLSLPADSGYRQTTDAKKGFLIETEQKRAGTIEIQGFSPSRLSVQDYLPAHDFESDKPIPLDLARPLLRSLRAEQKRAGPAGERRVMVSIRANPDAGQAQARRHRGHRERRAAPRYQGAAGSARGQCRSDFSEDRAAEFQFRIFEVAARPGVLAAADRPRPRCRPHCLGASRGRIPQGARPGDDGTQPLARGVRRRRPVEERQRVAGGERAGAQGVRAGRPRRKKTLSSSSTQPATSTA